MSQYLFAFHSLSRFCSRSRPISRSATTDGEATGPNPGAADTKSGDADAKSGDAAEAWRGDGTDEKARATNTARRFQQDGRVRRRVYVMCV